MTWDEFLLSEVKWHFVPEDVHDIIELGIGVWMVSDASKMESNATYAWAIADYDDVLCSNTGIVCGCKESITSYRAEAFGVLSLVTFLWSLFKNYDERDKKNAIHYIL